MANVYRKSKDVYDGQESYRVYTQSGMDQGDLAQWDSGSRYATNNFLASGSIFLGVAEGAQPLAGLGTTTRPLTNDRVRICSQGVYDMLTTNGETYSHLDAVFQEQTTATMKQRVTRNGSTRVVGRVHLPDGSQVSGTGSNSVPVRILGSMTNLSAVPTASDVGK